MSTVETWFWSPHAPGDLRRGGDLSELPITVVGFAVLKIGL